MLQVPVVALVVGPRSRVTEAGVLPANRQSRLSHSKAQQCTLFFNALPVPWRVRSSRVITQRSCNLFLAPPSSLSYCKLMIHKDPQRAVQNCNHVERERERERELRKEGREVPSRVRLREGPICVRITLGQPTIQSCTSVQQQQVRVQSQINFTGSSNKPNMTFKTFLLA